MTVVFVETLITKSLHPGYYGNKLFYFEKPVNFGEL